MPADQPHERAAGPPPSVQMIQMMTGFVFSQALYVVAELGIADLLAAGPRTSAELAAATGVHPPSLYRVLRTLASLGVFVEEEEQTFRLTALGAALRSDVPESARNFVMTCGRPLTWRAFGEMLYSVQTGQTGFGRAWGMPIFDYLSQHPNDAAVMGRTMIDIHGPEAAAVAAAYPLSGVKTLVDVGGGFGNLLTALLEANPRLRGVLFELPHIAAEASQRLSAAGLASRCEVVQGDFFASVPAGGDAYLFSHVVHDWDEAHCLTLLENCRRVMAPGGRLLIVEMVVAGANQPSPGKMMDLFMLAVAGGEERTEADYRDLLAKAGFRLTRVVPTASAASVIEAVPA